LVGGDHLSRPAVADWLSRPAAIARHESAESDLPAGLVAGATHTRAKYGRTPRTRGPQRPLCRPAAWSCRRWGLPCRRCHHRRGALLPSRCIRPGADSAGSTFTPKNESGHHFTIARSRRSSEERRRAVGCVFSVALSLGLLPVAVSHHRALPCSDFPPRLARSHARRPPEPPLGIYDLPFYQIRLAFARL
jgi:hypothetical protein